MKYKKGTVLICIDDYTDIISKFELFRGDKVLITESRCNYKFGFPYVVQINDSIKDCGMTQHEVNTFCEPLYIYKLRELLNGDSTTLSTEQEDNTL